MPGVEAIKIRGELAREVADGKTMASLIAFEQMRHYVAGTPLVNIRYKIPIDAFRRICDQVALLYLMTRRFPMPRVYLLVPFLLSLSACAASIIPPIAVVREVGDAVPGKSIIACTGLPVGEKCTLELPKRNESSATS